MTVNSKRTLFQKDRYIKTGFQNRRFNKLADILNVHYFQMTVDLKLPFFQKDRYF